MYRRQKKTQNYGMEIAGKRFEIEEGFKYLGRQTHVKIGLNFTYVLRAH